MTMAAIKGAGNSCLAFCVCDKCGFEATFPALHDTGSGHMHRAVDRKLELREPGIVKRRLMDMGWNVSGKAMICPKCEAARKAKQKEDAMTTKPATVTDIRQPTREQKRLIVEMLTDAYDTKAERYRGTDTDQTVADVIGGGCMSGWVSQIREEMFGPDGGNEEYEKLAADIATWRTNADKLASDMHGTLREFNDARQKVKDLSDRLSAVVKAAGPKARAM